MASEIERMIQELRVNQEYTRQEKVEILKEFDKRLKFMFQETQELREISKISKIDSVSRDLMRRLRNLEQDDSFGIIERWYALDDLLIGLQNAIRNVSIRYEHELRTNPSAEFSYRKFDDMKAIRIVLEKNSWVLLNLIGITILLFIPFLGEEFSFWAPFGVGGCQLGSLYAILKKEYLTYRFSQFRL